MPKPKTNKSVKKRVKITKNGKIKVHRPGRRHLMSCKNAKKRRALRKPIYIKGNFVKMFKATLAS